jgi:hypothetical protein
MPWFKIDDGFWSHPKVLDLSPDAVALWVRAGSYCAGHLTDGEVKPSILRLLGAESNHADELVAAGLWDLIDGSWWFHDWAEYQPPASATKEKRAAVSAARSQAGSKGAASRWQNDGKTDGKLPSVCHDTADGKPIAPTRPDPNPSTSTDVDVKNTRGTRLTDSWQPSPELIDWAKTERADIDPVKQADAFRDYWLSQPGQKGVKTDWDRTFKNWIRNSRGQTAKGTGWVSNMEHNMAYLRSLAAEQPSDQFEIEGAA